MHCVRHLCEELLDSSPTELSTGMQHVYQFEHHVLWTPKLIMSGMWDRCKYWSCSIDPLRDILLPLRPIARSAAEQQQRLRSWQKLKVLLKGTWAEWKQVLLEPGSHLLRSCRLLLWWILQEKVTALTDESSHSVILVALASFPHRCSLMKILPECPTLNFNKFDSAVWGFHEAWIKTFHWWVKVSKAFYA